MTVHSHHTFTFAFSSTCVLAIVSTIMWQVTTLAAQGEVNTSTFLHGLSEIFDAISGVVFIGADCPWLGRTRVLRCGEVTPAEILAVQANTTVYRHPNNWRYVEWKETPSKQNEVKAQLKRPQDTVENRQTP